MNFKDCCDGTDEYKGNANCQNKCVALASQKRQEEEKFRQLRDQGYTKRKLLMEEGTQIKKALEVKISQVETFFSLKKKSNR